MNLRTVLLAIVLLCPSLAHAGPITPTGKWSSISEVDGPFWDGLSWDCATCGVTFKLNNYTGLAGLDVLHDVNGGFTPFWFDDPVINPVWMFQQTGWMNGILGRDDETGAFTYNSGTGRISDSKFVPGQYVLFRRVGTTETDYFLGIEDILLTEERNDRDYNDYGVKFTLPTQSVPEPSTLLLLGLGVVGVASRRRRWQSRLR